MPECIRLIAPETLSGTYLLPASKSMYNRALVLSALTGNSVQCSSSAQAEDCQVMENYLAEVGYSFKRNGTQIEISGSPISGKIVQAELAMAGTALRFLSALAAVLPIHSQFSGADRLGQRPYLPLAFALKESGVHIHWSEGESIFPIRIQGSTEWKPEEIYLRNSQSSQFISALLLLGPYLNLGTQLICSQQAPLSEPYIDLTLGMLDQIGINWQRSSGQYELVKKSLISKPILVESDWSNASYAFGMLLLKGGTLHIPGLMGNSLQGDVLQVEYFQHLGMEFSWNAEGLEVSATGKKFPGFDLDFSGMPDLAQTFAVLAAFAEGPSILRGLYSLVFKETNRIEALQAELQKFGAKVEVEGDVMHIQPRFSMPTQEPIKTYGDHRMAMAFSIGCCTQVGGQIENPEVVSKSFPEYWDNLRQLGFVLEVD